MRCLLLPKRGLSNHEKSVSTRSCIIKNLFHSLDFFFDLSEVRASCVPKASRPICSQIIFLDHVLLGEFNHVLSVNINSIKFFPFSSALNLDFFASLILVSFSDRRKHFDVRFVLFWIDWLWERHEERKMLCKSSHYDVRWRCELFVNCWCSRLSIIREGNETRLDKFNKLAIAWLFTPHSLRHHRRPRNLCAYEQANKPWKSITRMQRSSPALFIDVYCKKVC